MEVKPLATAPIMMPAPAPAPVVHPYDIHLNASYKHTEIFMPQVKPIAHEPAPICPPVVAPYATWILVLFILLVIVTRSFGF